MCLYSWQGSKNRLMVGGTQLRRVGNLCHGKGVGMVLMCSLLTCCNILHNWQMRKIMKHRHTTTRNRWQACPITLCAVHGSKTFPESDYHDIIYIYIHTYDRSNFRHGFCAKGSASSSSSCQAAKASSSWKPARVGDGYHTYAFGNWGYGMLWHWVFRGHHH